MARIAGVNIPNEKIIVIALTYVFGIGMARARDIVKSLNIDPNTRTKDLSEEIINKLRTEVEKYKIEGALRRETLTNIKRLKEIKAFRGSRHAKGLPARGQRTKTNSRSVRGNVRKTIGSGKKPPAQKT